MNYIGTFIKRERGNIAGRLVVGYDNNTIYYLDVLKSKTDDITHGIHIQDEPETYYVSMDINTMPILAIKDLAQVSFEDMGQIFDKLCYYETCLISPQLNRVYDRYLAYIMENEEKIEDECEYIPKLERR